MRWNDFVRVTFNSLLFSSFLAVVISAGFSDYGAIPGFYDAYRIIVYSLIGGTLLSYQLNPYLRTVAIVSFYDFRIFFLFYGENVFLIQSIMNSQFDLLNDN